jgi:hypothetical protein
MKVEGGKTECCENVKIFIKYKEYLEDQIIDLKEGNMKKQY